MPPVRFGHFLQLRQDAIYSSDTEPVFTSKHSTTINKKAQEKKIQKRMEILNPIWTVLVIDILNYKAPYLCKDTQKMLQRSSSLGFEKRAEAGLYI